MKIYHYTTLETLALILKHNTLRFNCAKNVDDPHEAVTNDYGNMYDYIFISCWTDKDEENLALWSLYSKSGRGIRIESDTKYIIFDLKDSISGFLYGIVTNVESQNNKAHFINYIADDDVTGSMELYHRVIYTNEERHFYKTHTEAITEFDLSSLVQKKKEYWSFQNEIRFVLMGCVNEEGYSLNWQSIFNSITERKRFKCEYVDLQLKECFLENIKIRLGPLCTEADKIIVNSLLKEYIPRNINPLERSIIELRKM